MRQKLFDLIIHPKVRKRRLVTGGIVDEKESSVSIFNVSRKLQLVSDTWVMSDLPIPGLDTEKVKLVIIGSGRSCILLDGYFLKIALRSPQYNSNIELSSMVRVSNIEEYLPEAIMAVFSEECSIFKELFPYVDYEYFSGNSTSLFKFSYIEGATQ